MVDPVANESVASMNANSFVAVDWGTSSLRLWVMAMDGAIEREWRSPRGMASVPAGGFEPVLREGLMALGSVLDGLPSPLPIVLCGMVGARGGWREAGYLDIPAPLDRIAETATPVGAEGLDARILPGLAQRREDRPDVMRGEETQLLGVALHERSVSGLVCLPGTHSKWVTLDAGVVKGFNTVMTGELFAVLMNHSLLRHTLGAAEPTGDPNAAAFRAGLADALDDPAAVTSRLFDVRARELLYGVTGEAAADRLSGLLIGSEVGAAMREVGRDTIRLVATGRLARLYHSALVAAGGTVEIIDADEAVRAGLVHAARRLWPIPDRSSA